MSPGSMARRTALRAVERTIGVVFELREQIDDLLDWLKSVADELRRRDT